MDTSATSLAMRKGIEQQKRFDEKYAQAERENAKQSTKPLTLRKSWVKWEGRSSSYFKKLYAAIDSIPERIDVDLEGLHKVVGYPLPSSRFVTDHATHPTARHVFTKALRDALLPLADDDEVELYFVTILDQDWNLPRTATDIPLPSIELRAKRALRDIGYHGILFLEVQPLVGMKGTDLLVHLHGIAWQRRGEKSLPKRRAVERLGLRFKKVGTAHSVMFKQVKGAEALAQRMLYSAKLPDEAKATVQHASEKADGKLVSAVKFVIAAASNYTNIHALQIARLLSPYSVEEIVFAVGEGTKVRKAASRALDEYASKHQRQFVNRIDVQALWANIPR